MRIKIEIGAGELIDRLTILQIKADHILDQDKLANVLVELKKIERVRDRFELLHDKAIAWYAADLKRVNEALWFVEDDLRLCEKVGEFGPRFIDLARSVYRLNDERATLKREIDWLAGSTIVEEKLYAG